MYSVTTGLLMSSKFNLGTVDVIHNLGSSKLPGLKGNKSAYFKFTKSKRVSVLIRKFCTRIHNMTK